MNKINFHKVENTLPVGPWDPGDIYFVLEEGIVFQWTVSDDGVSAYPSGVEDSGSGTGAGLENTYMDIATMLADQANQTENGIQVVVDASADPQLESGYAYYQKLTSSTAVLADDYRLMSAEEVFSYNDDPETGTPKYITLRLGVVQNVGGVSGTQHRFAWTVQDHIDTDTFIHDTAINNSQITILNEGWYYIHHNFFASQTGANRMVNIGRLWVNDTIDPFFLPVTYGRGVTFGLYMGYQATYRKYFNVGDVVEIGTQVSDPDGTYTLNANINATYVTIHQEPGSVPGPAGSQGIQGLPGGIPSGEGNVVSETVDMGNFLTNYYNETTPYTGDQLLLSNLTAFGEAVVRCTTTGRVSFIPVIGSTQIDSDDFVASRVYDCLIQVRSDGITVEHKWISIGPT